jgi:hypothetical protein
MNHLNIQTAVGQNPKLLEEINWQESAIYGMVCMLKTDGVSTCPCISFPTFNVISFSFIKNSNPFLTIFGDTFR